MREPCLCDLCTAQTIVCCTEWDGGSRPITQPVHHTNMLENVYRIMSAHNVTMLFFCAITFTCVHWQSVEHTPGNPLYTKFDPRSVNLIRWRDR